jgi:hypothetical protein
MDDERGQDDEVAANIPYSLQVQAPEKKEPSVTAQATAAASPHPPAAEPEEAMKGLFGQLLQSMSGKTEQKIAQMLPQMVSTKLEAHVTKAVETEVHLQLGAAISQERLAEVVEPLLLKALPKVLSAEMSVLEPIIRHSMFEIASPLIKEQVEQMMREQADTVKQSLPEAVREHLRSMESDVREQLKQAAAEQAERLAADVVRTAAEAQIQTTVQKLIPSIVEDAIKAEIKRLTDAA